MAVSHRVGGATLCINLDTFLKFTLITQSPFRTHDTGITFADPLAKKINCTNWSPFKSMENIRKTTLAFIYLRTH